jgi:hypothetical protein
VRSPDGELLRSKPGMIDQVARRIGQLGKAPAEWIGRSGQLGSRRRSDTQRTNQLDDCAFSSVEVESGRVRQAVIDTNMRKLGTTNWFRTTAIVCLLATSSQAEDTRFDSDSVNPCGKLRSKLLHNFHQQFCQGTVKGDWKSQRYWWRQGCTRGAVGAM